jgi:hypothetical protein
MGGDRPDAVQTESQRMTGRSTPGSVDAIVRVSMMYKGRTQ